MTDDALFPIIALAARYHNDTFRKGGDVPYIEHPKAVVAQLERWGLHNSEGELAVAWGHDLMEDTQVSRQEIVAATDEQTCQRIEMLTRREEVFPDKADYIRHVAEHADIITLLVKISDRLCNTRDFIQLKGKDKARRYFREAEPIQIRLNLLVRSGDTSNREALVAAQRDWEELAAALV